MALIKCKECTRQISDKAKICPHCGYPYNFTVSKQGGLGSVESVDLKVSQLLMDFGVPVYLLGYDYLHRALLLCLEEPFMVHQITTSLYPAIAEVFHTNSQKVERAIRYAVESAWHGAKKEELVALFSFGNVSIKRRPSNGAFIALMTKQLQSNR